MRRRQLLMAVVLSGLAARAVACAADDTTGGTVGGVGGMIGKGGSSSGDGHAGKGGGFMLDSSASGDGALTADSACVGETKQAEKIPLSMYIMLDKSGSMVNFGSPKWSEAVNAINAFVSDQSLVAVKVALQVWSGEGPCDGSVYDTPAIPMGPVPQGAPQIASWLSSISPNGNTPTQGALLGLQKYCTQYAAQNPGEKVVGLLVTDGLPTSCDLNPGTLAGVASAAFSGTPSVLIYTMGMDGADFNLLDQLAQAGGTGTAFNANSTQAFLDALKAISGSALSCEFEIPTPDNGVLDPDKVNVLFTPSVGNEQPLFKVDNQAACVQWGWYYDDPANPTRVILCPETCNIAKADPQGRIDLILGCKSNPPT